MKIFTGHLDFSRTTGDFFSTYCILHSSPQLVTKSDDFLVGVELLFYKKLLFEKRIGSYLGGRYTAKLSIAELIGNIDLKSISIEMGVFDNPVVHVLHSNTIKVSISHSKNMVVSFAYFEQNPIAIDIEYIQAGRESFLENTFSKNELAFLDQLQVSCIEGLTLLWTVKEALSKILQTGLMADFSVFEVSDMTRKENVLVSHFKYFHQYKVLSLIIGDYAVSVIIPRMTEVRNFDEFSKNFKWISH